MIIGLAGNNGKTSTKGINLWGTRLQDINNAEYNE